MSNISEDKDAILYKLWRNGRFGRGHMLIDNLLHGFPNSEVGNIKTALDQLIKDKLVVIKPTKHGHAVHINLNLRKSIEQRLKKRYHYI